jgi:hypothetical protein
MLSCKNVATSINACEIGGGEIPHPHDQNTFEISDYEAVNSNQAQLLAVAT